MVTNLDIWRAASVVIEHHGEDAEIVAAQRADSFLERGDLDGNRVWMRILAKVKELRREKPAGGEAVN